MKKNTNSNKPEENGIYAGTSDRIIDDVVKGKRDYKDSLFCFIFGSEEYKENNIERDICDACGKILPALSQNGI